MNLNEISSDFSSLVFFKGKKELEIFQTNLEKILLVKTNDIS